jgi:hypothetical protein
MLLQLAFICLPTCLFAVADMSLLSCPRQGPTGSGKTLLAKRLRGLSTMCVCMY